MIDSYEGMVEGQGYGVSYYVATYPFTDQDIESVKWLFEYGRVDGGWSDKPMPVYIPNPARGYIELTTHPFERPIMKLTTALKPIPASAEAKVKYFAVLQSKSYQSSHKLVVAATRRGFAMDLFHEFLNGNSIIFTGAVLKEVTLGAASPPPASNRQFKKVGSVEEAVLLSSMDQNIVGVIC